MAETGLAEKLHATLWERDWRSAPIWQRAGIDAVRIAILVGRDLSQGDLSMRAMSLVYTTLLSIVPLLALSFSVLKGFGVQNRLDETLQAALAPLGSDKAQQLTESLIGFVNNMNVGVLGTVGLGFLLFTVISLTQKIEAAFNQAWRINTPRSFGERFTTFLSAITVGPLLVLSAIAATGSVMNTSVMTYLRDMALLGEAIDLAIRLLPFVLIISAFTFLYAAIPNTRVKVSAALTGGIVSGVLWESLSLGFAAYASGASNYQLVYATFATAIFFMIWLYLNWLILLIGASICYYRQHSELVATGLKEVAFSPVQLRRYSLSVLTSVGRRFYNNEPAATLEDLAAEHGVHGNMMQRCIDELVEVGLLAPSGQTVTAYVPAVPYDTTTLVDVLTRLENYQPPESHNPPGLTDKELDSLENTLAEARSNALADLTLKQLVEDTLDQR
ncbi:MAG: YhjD/YihY/BrkB family envelope integrity protein [Pseudomonadales bacterium]